MGFLVSLLLFLATNLVESIQEVIIEENELIVKGWTMHGITVLTLLKPLWYSNQKG
jgi:hypothetical protein